MRTLVMTTLAAAAAACGANAESISPTPDPELPRERAVERSRAAFEEALARYDKAPANARAELAPEVDRLAAQKYATVSRLYWHTDLDDALAEARETGKPVLSLRMLGRLDSDYSCANSRFFRVALYANAEVSTLLRETFVLHWSSERDAPVITVDFGDGRVMKRTLAGNSAHYVLDSRGRPVDVLPGLYGPEAFMAGLRNSAKLAASLGGLDDSERAAALQDHHRLARLLPAATPVGSAVVSILGSSATIRAAESIAVTKAAVEVPVITAIDYARGVDRARGDGALRARLATLVKPVHLDAQSRALIATLAPIDWGSSHPLEGAALDQLIAAFETQIAIDTALNEYGLRPLLRSWFADRTSLDASFEELNARVYSELFLTPRDDPWLGMAASGAFTALPSSGITRAPRR